MNAAPVAWLMAATAVAGCIGPQVEDEPDPGHAVLPPGTVLPDADDDLDLAERIEANDGVDELVPIGSAFAGGAPIGIWDFGPAPEFAAPMFILVRREGGGVVPVGHPTLIEVAPGDEGYSPYWVAYLVHVTDAYAGEVIPSVAAIDEAVRRGLIEPPVALGGDVGRNCPIVAGDVELARPGGLAPLPPPSTFYYRGRRVHYFDLGAMPVVERIEVPESRRYVLRREGQEPLNERIRNIDMTGDGDTLDSNDIHELTAGESMPSPSCRTVAVAVPAATASIDTSGDQEIADLRDGAQLFDPDPVAGVVLAFETTDELRNCAPVRPELFP